ARSEQTDLALAIALERLLYQQFKLIEAVAQGRQFRLVEGADVPEIALGDTTTASGLGTRRTYGDFRGFLAQKFAESLGAFHDFKTVMEDEKRRAVGRACPDCVEKAAGHLLGDL